MAQHPIRAPLWRAPLWRASQLWIAAILGLTLAAPPARAGDALQVEETKAAMLYNFGRFAVWPEGRFARPDDPVVICIDPADPLAPALASIDGKPLGGRVIQVRRTARPERSCHMAYVSAAAASDAVLASLNEHGVLTVGESAEFERAGAIRLVTIGGQVRFEINQHNAAAAGVRLSSNLMRLAVVVR